MAHPDNRIYLFRHGETEWSAAKRHTGLTDIPLNDKGKDEARELRSYVSDISFSRVITSPLQRARQTCELAGLCDDAEENSQLVEWDYGDYEGITSEEIHRDRPGWNIFTDGVPNGETLDDVEKRADRVVAALRDIEGNVAVFGHGHILRVLAVRWLELPASAGRHFLLYTSTMNILGYYHQFPAIVTWNASLSKSNKLDIQS